jgi:hypothetical protein
MTTLRQAAQQALEALETKGEHHPRVYAAINALRTALEREHAMHELARLGQEIEQEPVAYYHPRNGFYWAKPTSIFAPTSVDVEPLPLYAAVERNT